MGVGRNDRIHTVLRHERDQRIGIIPLIADDRVIRISAD